MREQTSERETVFDLRSHQLLQIHLDPFLPLTSWLIRAFLSLSLVSLSRLMTHPLMTHPQDHHPSSSLPWGSPRACIRWVVGSILPLSVASSGSFVVSQSWSPSFPLTLASSPPPATSSFSVAVVCVLRQQHASKAAVARQHHTRSYAPLPPQLATVRCRRIGEIRQSKPWDLWHSSLFLYFRKEEFGIWNEGSR
jgi:hypothetical protein